MQAFRSRGHEVVCPAPRPPDPSLNIRAAIANSPARTAERRRSRRTISRRHGSDRSEPRVHRNGYRADARTGEKGQGPSPSVILALSLADTLVR